MEMFRLTKRPAKSRGVLFYLPSIPAAQYFSRFYKVDNHTVDYSVVGCGIIHKKTSFSTPYPFGFAL